eukprot:sb/3478748/
MKHGYLKGSPSTTTNQNSLFRSRDWLSANQGPVFPDSVGSCPILYCFYFELRGQDSGAHWIGWPGKSDGEKKTDRERSGGERKRSWREIRERDKKAKA